MKITKWAIASFLFASSLSFAQTQPNTLIGQGSTQRPTAVFEENKGQMKDQNWQPRPDVLYYGNAGGMNYYIRNNGMSYQLSRVECWKDAEDPKHIDGTVKKQVPEEIGTYRVDAEWLGNNTDYTVTQGTALEGYNNYYNVPVGVEPALFVKQYEAITLQNLWNGIDVHYYSTDGQLETDYLVAPDADYRQIRMEIKGADLSIGADGHLVMKTPFGEIHEGSLKVYQGDQLVAANWVTMGNIVSFDVPNYDPCLALRIDPLVRVWGTYYGGSDFDWATSIDLDANGNIFMGGSTYSTNNIASGGHQNTYFGFDDIFLVKFNGLGGRMWGTYMGGWDIDNVLGCSADKNSNSIYIVGETRSDFNIATTGSFQDVIGGPGGGGYTDGFVSKFSTLGVLQWSTYYGSGGSEGATACAVDFNGDLFVCGYADSGPVIGSGGHQTLPGGLTDGFITKFNSSGFPIWSSYYGGSWDDRIEDCKTDGQGNVYFCGFAESQNNIAFGGFQNTANKAPFLVKMNGAGVRQWATYYGNDSTMANACAVDRNGNVYMAGFTKAKLNIASGGHQNTISRSTLFTNQDSDGFLVKFNSTGAREWATYYGGNSQDEVTACVVDTTGNVYIAGWSSSTDMIASGGYQNTSDIFNVGPAFLAKFAPNGIRQWGTYYYGKGGIETNARTCAIDKQNNVYLAGYSSSDRDIAINAHQTTLGGADDAFLVKFTQAKIYGTVWLDLNADCVRDSAESNVVNNIRFTIQPGNYVAQSNGGTWSIDSLPAGTYTVTIDTANQNWIYTCPISQSFTVTNPAGETIAPSFGLIAKYPCAKLNVSISMPRLRRGFANQVIYLDACNLNVGTDSLTAGYVIVELDANISVQSGSSPYTSLGNNKFRVNVGTLYPDKCVRFTFSTTVELTAVANQSLCMSAEIFPQPLCALDSLPIPNLLGSGPNPCATSYDNSRLQVSATCANDSVRLVVYNQGTGNMTCTSPVLIFLDGQVHFQGSITLSAGDSIIYKYSGSNQTWHIQTAQHPLNFAAEPYPTASIERCGTGTWTPGLINALPQADAQPIRDIFCGQVSAPFDPNDKTGFPKGSGITNNILPTQDIEYMIRFQNVGTDTAFKVVIRDTLTQDLDILSLRTGTSSHPYQFRMYGPRILEWTFENIQLPDSTTNEPASNGFVKFKIKQKANLPDGTIIENRAGIYFDFEAPVITNTYAHTIARYSNGCNPTTSTTTATACGSYTWNGQTYSLSDTYTYQTTNAAGCDSTATLELTIESDFVTDTIAGLTLVDTMQTYTYSVVADAAVDTYTWGISCGQITSGSGTNIVSVTWDGPNSCQLWVIRSNAACIDTLQANVSVDFGSSIKETFLSQLSLYPNPTNGLTTITWGQTLEQQPTLVLIDALNRVIAVPVDCRDNGCTIDTRNLPAGVYTIMLNHPNGNAIRKLIKTE